MTESMRVAGLTKSFAIRGSRKRRVCAVDDVSFVLHKARTLGLLGESGSGKSTTGALAVRLLDPDAGSVSYAGRDVTRLRGRELRLARVGVQMVFQNPRDSLNPRMSVGDSIAEPLRINRVSSKEATRRVAGLLDDVGLTPDQGRRMPSDFSGGQLQRVAIARALALRPAVLVLDEPVSALDVSVQAQVLNLLRDLQAEHSLSYLFISHDVSVVRYMSDDVAVMRAGRIVESGPSAMLDSPQDDYTRELLSSVPSFARITQPQSAKRK